MICTFSILYLVFAQIAVDSDAENGMFFQIEFRVDMIKLQSYFDVIRVSNQMLEDNFISMHSQEYWWSVNWNTSNVQPNRKYEKKIRSKMFYENSFSFEKCSRFLMAFYNCQWVCWDTSCNLEGTDYSSGLAHCSQNNYPEIGISLCVMVKVKDGNGDKTDTYNRIKWQLQCKTQKRKRKKFRRLWKSSKLFSFLKWWFSYRYCEIPGFGKR